MDTYKEGSKWKMHPANNQTAVIEKVKDGHIHYHFTWPNLENSGKSKTFKLPESDFKKVYEHPQ